MSGRRDTAMSNKKRTVWILIVTALFAAMLMLTSSAHAAARGNKWLALRLRFKPGQRLEYALTVTMSGTNVVSGAGGQQEIPVDRKTRIDFRYDVLDVDPEGTAKVKITVDEINADVESMGQNVNIRIGASGMKVYSGGQPVVDSAQIDGVYEMPMNKKLGLGDMPSGVQFGDLFRKGITVQITRTGEMTVPGIEQGNGDSLGVLEHFEPERLPEKLVRPGDTWIFGASLPGLDEDRALSYGLTLNCTFEGIEDVRGRRCAKHAGRWLIDLSERPEVLELLPQIKAYKSRGEGAEYLDLSEGVISKTFAEIFQEVIVVRQVGTPAPVGGGGTQPQNVEVFASAKIVLELELKE
jgi:hypothetical protein